jgi:serine phosphatase RsbU (regulator of sigma subunit)
MLYAVLNPEQRTPTFASAGHLRPILVNGSGGTRFRIGTRYSAGGWDSGNSESKVHLPEGSRLVFYSDGITETESPDGEEYERRGRSASLLAGCHGNASPKACCEFANGAGLPMTLR